MVELILTGAVVAAAIALGIAARKLGREGDKAFEAGLIAFCLVGMIWVSPLTRSIIVGIAALAIAWELGLVATIVVAGAVFVTGMYLPGGVSVLLFGVLALVGIGQVRSARRHLERLSRADTLVANEPVMHEVELTGNVRAVVPTIDPVREQPCAMWHVFSAKGTRESTSLVEIRGATGSAIIDPATVRIEWSRDAESITGDDARKAAEVLRLELGDSGSLFLRVLPEGTECYVVGKPAWEMAPANTVGLYRDAPVLPTFRATETNPAWFADRSEAQLRGDHVWALVVWGTWASLCAAIATVQLAGWT